MSKDKKSSTTCVDTTVLWSPTKYNEIKPEDTPEEIKKEMQEKVDGCVKVSQLIDHLISLNPDCIVGKVCMETGDVHPLENLDDVKEMDYSNAVFKEVKENEVNMYRFTTKCVKID